MQKFSRIPLTAVKLNDPFFSPRVIQALKVTIPSALAKCRDTGRLDAFKLAPEMASSNIFQFYWDSDVGKVLEGMAYLLAVSPDAELEKYYDEIIDLVVSAQQPDGYINTAVTMLKTGQNKDLRWKDLTRNHELYCAGHLMEAAVAGYELLGKKKFFDAMCRYADHIASVFGWEDGKRYGIPGHPEVELALMKLYRASGREEYLRTAKYFIDARGSDPEFFRKECPASTWPAEMKQAHKPVREQDEAIGHAVRALYLYCGMADVAAATGDESLLAACETICSDIINRKMYISGNVGSSFDYESFSTSYDLPNDSRSYAESCAGMAMVLLMNRMFNITGKSIYADVMERALYNGALAGISLAGDEFFYSNYLEVNDNFHKYNSGSKVRQKWFLCSCCPTSYCRFLPQISSFIWSASDDELRLNIPAANTLTWEGKVIEVCGNYPFDSKVKVIIHQGGSFKLSFRLPDLSQGAVFTLNGKTLPVEEKDHAVVIQRDWQSGDVIEYEMYMPFVLIRSLPQVTMNRGMAAIMRGPVVYCCESIDQICDVSALRIKSNTGFSTKKMDIEGNYMAVECDGVMVRFPGDGLYFAGEPEYISCRITAVPYALWQNRGESNMSVWLPELLC